MRVDSGNRAGDQPAWPERRRAAVAAHESDQRRRRATEARQARQLVMEFVRAARERGVSPTPLTAQAHHGRTRYRTGLHGWYLKSDRSVAIGTDGAFYLLTVPASLRARFLGTPVTPTEPKMTIGAGGRDGESIPLADLLKKRLAAGNT